MRTLFVSIVLFIVNAMSVAYGAIAVSSFSVTAGTIGFAPLDQSDYYEVNTIVGTSPAIVDANGNWTGTNFGGSTETWHWVGSAHANVTTNVSSTSLSIAGVGSFSRDMVTTADFVSPSNQTVLYAPGSGASYRCFFSIDTPSSFSLGGLLSRYSDISLFSFTENKTVYSKINNLNQPFLVDLSGIIQPGEYSVRTSTGLGGTIDSGASHEFHTGSFTNFLFTVQVPEPASLGILPAGFLFLRRFHRARVR